MGGVGGGVDLDAASMDQRTRLLNGTDRLADSSRRLQDSHKVALETGQIPGHFSPSAYSRARNSLFVYILINADIGLTFFILLPQNRWALEF